jgi:dolichol-phosphate mannosyltransferase
MSVDAMMVVPGKPAPTSSTRSVPAWAWLLAAVVMVQTAVVAFFPVLPEEAYHWNFARHLDWGYFDHPPMLPWSIALGRALLGDTVLGIRLVPLLFSIGTSILLARLARRFYGEAAALWAVLLYALQPAAFLIGSWGFPDSPVLFFWMLTLTCVWNVLDGGRSRWWLAAGAALGAGMLSKYTAAFLVPSVFLYLVFSRRDRRWLLTPWPYLAGVSALVVFSPVILWNWGHEWVSFRMQSTGRFEAMQGLSLGCGLQATAEQLVFVLPLTFPLALVVVGWLARSVRGSKPTEQFLLWTFAPMAGFFFVLGWTHSWHVLWSLPAYQALTIAMAAALANPSLGGRLYEVVARFYRVRWRWIVVPQCFGTVMLTLHGAFVLPVFPPLRETYGWNEAAELSRNLRSTLPRDSFYLAVGGRAYPSPSQLAFHLGKPGQVFGQNLVGLDALQYRFWADPQSLKGRDAVVVVEGEDPYDLARLTLLRFFSEVEPARAVDVPAGEFGNWSAARARFRLFVAHGYKPG